MTEPEFHRIRRLPPYVFAEVNRLKAAARASGKDIIDLGMGNPDSPTPAHIVEKLVETVRDGKTHRYSTSRGIPGLRKAWAGYYARRFGVRLDPETQVCVTLGSKEGLANLAQAITAPGDTILTPNPSYPIHPFGFIIAGASIRHVPFGPRIDLMRELARAAEHSVPKPSMVVLNFPSNPTALTCGLDFYKEVVAWARQKGIWLLSDIAYAEIYFGDQPPPSILEAPGAFDVAIEFGSLSKTYSMPGWRIGFAAGNTRLVGALTRIKSYLDYGAFTPVQVAATAALNGPQDCVDGFRELYRGPPRRAGRRPGQGRLAGAQARGHHVLLGARARAVRGAGLAWASPSSCSRRPRSPWRRGSASASMARAMSASPWSRTATACARPSATSAAFSPATATVPRPPPWRWHEGRFGPAADRHRRPGHGRCRHVPPACGQCRAAGPADRPTVRGDGGQRPRSGPGARARSVRRALARRCRAALAEDPEVDLVCELIGGSEGVAAGPGARVAAARAPGGHRQQGDAGRARRRAGAPGRGRGDAAALRGRGRRRHPDRPLARPGTGRQPHPAGLRHPQRHLQLHPDHHARDRARVRRRAGRGAGLGYAEADPAFDVDGIDAAHKLALLAALAFGGRPRFDAIHIEGIRHVSAMDIAFAEQLGYRIKLLGVARVTQDGLEQRMHPCMVPAESPIGQVEGVFNGVVVEGDQVGSVVHEGRGAGAGPTASAVVGDIVDLARGTLLPTFGVPARALADHPIAPMSSHAGCYYIRLMVLDQPGVLADISAVLRDHEVSIESLIQRGRNPGQAVPIVLTSHDTTEAHMRGALDRIAALPAVLEPPRMIRIERS